MHRINTNYANFGGIISNQALAENSRKIASNYEYPDKYTMQTDAKSFHLLFLASYFEINEINFNGKMNNKQTNQSKRMEIICYIIKLDSTRHNW